MRRLFTTLCLTLAWLAAPASGNDTLEPRVQEIERLGVTAHWRESNARIDDIAPRLDELSVQQRQRVSYVRLRSLGLAGNEREALDGLSALLREEMPADLRLRIYTTAISIAANLEEWPQAFAMLGEGLDHVSEADSGTAGLLGAASYLHSLVGETDKARDLALQALHEVERGNDARALCVAVADVALAEDHAGNYVESERWRRRQIDACGRAGDLVFLAGGKYGMGKMAARLGRQAEARDWARRALADFETAGFGAGSASAKQVLAESLIASDRDLDRARQLLHEALAHYEGRGSALAIAETEHLLTRVAERRGDLGAALQHLKRAKSASEAAERGSRARRLAYLQVEFDTRLKEQQIALLKAETELGALQVTATKRRQWLLVVGMAGLLVTALLLLGLLRHSARERKRYRWQSEHDSLTRLYNYQHTRKLGEDAFARARADGKPFTAIVADIDLFKQVNDRHGHAAGDEALRRLGEWIAETVGDRGIAGRSGGDEFTILLEGDAEAAEDLLARLRGRIEPVTVFGQTVRFNLSSGFCEANGRATTLEQLVHEADQALYRAKHAGRNRVVRSSGDGTAVPLASAGLVVVGSGIEFGRHVGERCLSEIREAQVVFCLVDAFALAMIRDMRPDAINLGVHYEPGKDRRQTYREIDAAVMAQVRAGKQVCAVFYGHPGVFADVPHAIVRKAREEGIPARMEPGISAEACLYADLGIDPGRRGVQSMEATHFLVYDREPDTAGLVLLWQVALSGDLACSRLHAEPAGLQALVDKLLRWYPPTHEVLLYEAARLPIEQHRADRMALSDLPVARYVEYTTLVIPPLGSLREDPLFESPVDGHCDAPVAADAEGGS